MTSFTELYTKANQVNPEREKAKALAAGTQNIPTDRYGYGSIAKIIPMAMQGRAMRNAAEIDKEKSAAAGELVGGQIEQKEAQSVIKNVLEISKQDPKGATDVLNKYASMNPSLQPFQGIEFTQPTTEEGWISTNKGQIHVSGIQLIGKLKSEGRSDEEAHAEAQKQGLFYPDNKVDPNAMKVGATKERLLAKIAEGGVESLSDSERQAWDILSDDDKTIALEVMKSLRASVSYKSLNDENDPDGSKREAMIRGMEETIRGLFKSPVQPDQKTAGDYFKNDVGYGTDIDPVQGRYSSQSEKTAEAQPNMSQARRAPDGKLYLPDPNRPGKYLLVEE